ncbi:limbin isoform X1 [Bombina bombina]|uniref:limbin isoform X1 n=1 Tax=Bombina bombina TaxID=8345 RepID=UPI00235AF54F|nr:limbin isoform X1 [Bombina bombina]
MYTRLSLGFTTLITLHITSGSMLLLDKFLITDLGTSPWFNVNESLCNPVSASDQSEKYIDSTMSHICVSLLAKSNSLRTSVDFQLDGHGYNLVQSFNQKQRKTKKGTRPGEADVQQIERLIRGRDDSSIFLTSAASGSVWSQSVFFLIPSWIKKSFIKREAVPNRPQQRDGSRISWNGIIFLKCAMVNNREDLETATVHLLINSTDVSSPAMNMSNLIISDNITGIAIKDVSGTSTASVKGIQTFRKESLKAGEYILITYTASLNAEFAKYGSEFYLPAQLTFQNSSEGSSKLLVAPFTITANGNLKVVPNHGLHGAAFVIAFIVSLVLTGAICFAVYYIKKKRQSSLETKSKFKNEQKLEQSQINLQENANEDFIVYDKMIDILAFEEAENMLQALEDSEITNMSQADSYLEISRVHIYKDVTSIFVRNLTITLNLSPHETKMLSTVLNEQWTDLEKRINEEQQRRIVALTAECSLDTRKQMDIQYRKQKAASTEAEESSTEYKHLLDNLHDLEQAEMKRLLLFKQEEQFAKSHRQLSIAYRTELHNIFFDQLHNSVSRGKMKPDVQSVMIENYLKVQEESEDLMDFIQANKKYHMSRRISNRKNLIYSIQLCDSKCRCLLNSAATQISNLINRTERAGHMTESHAQLLLERAQSEVLKVKEKMENLSKIEKRKLHQKLITKRKRQLIQKLKEQKKDLGAVQEICKTTKDVNHYLECWKQLFSDHCQELEELFEKHDNDTVEELKGLKCSLTEKAIEDLRQIQSSVVMQEMLKQNVPRLHLQQVTEEHKRETALLGQQLDHEESDKVKDSRTSLESSWRKLEEEFKLGVKEQKSLRHWEQQLFVKIILLPLSLSEEDIQKIRQSFMCGFSQMDITLALPKIQGRKLLQTYLTEWRKEELLKLDHNVPESEKQLNVKTKNHLLEKPTEPFMKSIEDKILIYEAQMPDDMIKQARGELLIQRVHQLKDREYKLGEYIASLQFQLIANKSKELEIHMAVQHLQSLLLEEMCRSQIATESEYGKLLETRIQEIREIDQNMESWQQKEVENDKLNENYLSSIICEMNSTCEEDLDMPLSATLRSALNRRQNILRLYGERLQKEELEFAMVENQVEKAHMDEFIRLYKQDIRLTSYLTKRTLLPEGLLYQALNLLLPSSLETEIFSVLNSVSHKYSDGVTETDNIEEETDSWRKRKHQELWTVIEKRLKEGLVIQDNDKSSSARRKKRSILKKKRLRPVKRVSFSHTEDFSKLLQSVGRSKQFGNSEERELPENGEKLFIFRAPSETLKSSSVHKKKRNFLNFKKAMSAGV